MFLVELTLKATQRKIWNRLSRQSLGAYHFRAKTNPEGTRNHWSRPFCFRSDREGTKTSRENAWKCSSPIPTRLTKELPQPRQNKVTNFVCTFNNRKVSVHLAAVLVLSTTWNHLFCNHVDDGSTLFKKKKIIFFSFFAFYLKTAYTSLIPGWLVLQAKRLKVINK